MKISVKTAENVSNSQFIILEEKHLKLPSVLFKNSDRRYFVSANEELCSVSLLLRLHLFVNQFAPSFHPDTQSSFSLYFFLFTPGTFSKQLWHCLKGCNCLSAE